MYLQNKYTKWYYGIIESAKSRQLVGYRERHHIIPKSLGGSNDQNNLVSLTAREHFVCHLLLPKMVSEKKHLTSVRFALAKFRQYNANQERTILNSWEFAQVRKAHSLAARDSMLGRVLPPRSAEHRAKLSKAHKGKPSPLRGRVGCTAGHTLTEEHKKKIGDAQRGKKMNLSDVERHRRSEHLKKFRQSRAGAVLSDKTRKKISNACQGRSPYNKGLPAAKLECPHCHKLIGGHSNFTRWHNENCKSNPVSRPSE